jgi:hypothetical protein
MTNLKVTLSSAEVALAADAGSVTVSVTNTGVSSDRVVLGVYPPLDAPTGDSVPADATATPADVAQSAAAWTTIERPLREIAAGATEQFVATFDAKDAGPGLYKARFIAYSATRAPEEFSDQAGIVTITKQAAPAEPAAKGRPWWILVAVGVLVLLIAGAVFALLQRNDEPVSKPPPAPTSTTALPTSPASPCKPGLVPRLARPTDLVCVTRASAAQVIYDNNPDVQAARLPNPRGGPYGPNTCLQGYVWREAFEGDVVCVDGATRSRSRQENADAAANAGS